MSSQDPRRSLGLSFRWRRRAFAAALVSGAILLLGAATSTAGSAGWSTEDYVNGSFRLSAQAPNDYVRSPDAYRLPEGGSEDVIFEFRASNPTGHAEKVPVYFTVWHILTCTSPLDKVCTATDISTGEPGDVSEAQFRGHSLETTQERAYPKPGVSIPAPDGTCAATSVSCFIVLDPHQTRTISFTARLGITGYFQIDVGSSPSPCGEGTGPQTCDTHHEGFRPLSIGFTRILPEHGERHHHHPHPTPPSSSHSPSPTPSSGSSPTPTPTPGSGPPPTSGVQGVTTSNPSGGVLGATSPAVPSTGAGAELWSRETIAAGLLGAGGLLLLAATGLTRRRQVTDDERRAEHHQG